MVRLSSARRWKARVGRTLGRSTVGSQCRARSVSWSVTAKVGRSGSASVGALNITPEGGFSAR